MKREALAAHRFELDLALDKLEPTVYEGEDLDLPTFLRRGIKIA
jgi:hypothetical protein